MGPEEVKRKNKLKLQAAINEPSHLHAVGVTGGTPFDTTVHYSENRTLQAGQKMVFPAWIFGTVNAKLLQIFYHCLCPICGASEHTVTICHVAVYKL